MIEQIIARIKAQIPPLKLVGEAADFQAAAESNPATGPAAFVFMATEAGQDVSLTGRARQRVDVTFTVVYAVKNVASVKGRGNAQALAPLKSATRTALIGWRPNGAEALVGFVSGQQLAFRQGWQWWADNFKTQILIP